MLDLQIAPARTGHFWLIHPAGPGRLGIETAGMPSIALRVRTDGLTIDNAPAAAEADHWATPSWILRAFSARSADSLARVASPRSELPFLQQIQNRQRSCCSI